MHSEVGQEVHNVHNKLWESEHFSLQEEAMPKMEVKSFRKAAAAFKANTGVGVGWTQRTKCVNVRLHKR